MVCQFFALERPTRRRGCVVEAAGALVVDEEPSSSVALGLDLVAVVFWTLAGGVRVFLGAGAARFFPVTGLSSVRASISSFSFSDSSPVSFFSLSFSSVSVFSSASAFFFLGAAAVFLGAGALLGAV